MTNNKQQNTEPKCTCVEHDPYCCQIHGSCPACVKPEDPKDVVLGHKTSLVAQTLDSKENKQQTAVEWLWEIEYNRELTVADWKQAKKMEKEQSSKYAAFCVICDRNKLPLIDFEDWIKLGDEQ